MATFQGAEYKFPDENTVEVNLDGKEDKLDIEVVDDTPPVDQGRKPMTEPPKEFTDDELTTYNESVQKRIKHFTKGYHDERRAKEAAARERDEAAKVAQALLEENKKLKGSLNQGHVALLEQAKKNVENEVVQAKLKYKQAYESGDSDAMSDAQAELTQAAIKAERLNNFKQPSLQDEKIAVQTTQTQPAPLDRKAEAWKNDNPWFGSNRRMTSYALALHEELTQDEHINPSSEEYYQRINSEMRERFPDAFEAEEVDAPPPPKRTNVAPATRSTATRKVVLTTSQQNIAKRLGLSLEDYAKSVAKLAKGA